MKQHARNWVELWNGNHPLWINGRHIEVRCRLVTDDILKLIAGRSRPVVLDYGCGEALEARRFAGKCEALFLYEAPSAAVDRLRRRFSSVENIRVVDDEGVERLPAESIDVVVMSSVVQYMSERRLGSLLARFSKILRPDGEVLIGDIIPPRGDHLNYVWTLLRDGIRYGYFWGAVWSILRMRFSEYWDLKRNLKYSYYSDSAMESFLGQNGFHGSRVSFNIGGNAGRMSFRAVKMPTRSCVEMAQSMAANRTSDLVVGEF